MKATDLRIGNCIEVKIGLQDKLTKMCYRAYVTKVCFSHIVVNGRIEDDGIYVDHDFVYPIPLTEELLLKCGFIRTSLYKNYKLSIREDLHIVVSLSEKRHAYVNVLNIEAIHVIYLHQLQNLYYALTNKELEVNI